MATGTDLADSYVDSNRIEPDSKWQPYQSQLAMTSGRKLSSSPTLGVHQCQMTSADGVE